MTLQTKEEITKLLIVAGYEKELNDIFFIEDIKLIEVEPIAFHLGPIECGELY